MYSGLTLIQQLLSLFAGKYSDSEPFTMIPSCLRKEEEKEEEKEEAYQIVCSFFAFSLCWVTSSESNYQLQSRVPPGLKEAFFEEGGGGLFFP